MFQIIVVGNYSPAGNIVGRCQSYYIVGDIHSDERLLYAQLLIIHNFRH